MPCRAGLATNIPRMNYLPCAAVASGFRDWFFLITLLKTDSLRPGQLPHCVYPGESRLELLQHCCSGTTRPTNVCDRPTCPL